MTNSPLEYSKRPLAQLAVGFGSVRQAFAPTPFKLVWPTEYPVITQVFGNNPDYYGQWGLPGHEGIDFKALHGTLIFACADGLVYRVEGDPASNNYGIHVRIKHRDGFSTVYAHLMMPTVAQGDVVVAGQVIGLADNTGNSHGDHLHLTLKLENATRDGKTRYPGDIIASRSARPQGGLWTKLDVFRRRTAG